MKINRVLGSATDVLFPPKCAVCGEFISDRKISRALCRGCYTKYLYEADGRCRACGNPYKLCACTPKGFSPDGFAYALPYEAGHETVRKLILGCKSRRNAAVIRLIVSEMTAAAAAHSIPLSGALITYVPRAPGKFEKTGVDQSEGLAREFAKANKLKLAPLLSRRYIGREQKHLSRLSREANARNVYRLVSGAEKITASKTIIIIDDIITTGATVNACTEILKNAGAKNVFCLTAAKSIKPADGRDGL